MSNNLNSLHNFTPFDADSLGRRNLCNFTFGIDSRGRISPFRNFTFDTDSDSVGRSSSERYRDLEQAQSMSRQEIDKKYAELKKEIRNRDYKSS